MKILTKKFISFILAFLFALSFTSVAYAKEVQPQITFIGTLQVVSAPVAGSVGSAGISGHSFIIVKNESNATITVGHMPVSAGDSVTIGTYGNRSAHKGIWYNIEGYVGLKGTSYGLKCGITMSDLSTMNSVINNNDSWSLTNNCSVFAKKVWNAVYTTQTISGTDPATLANSIKKKDFYTTNPTIPKKSKSSIARHTSTSYVIDSSGATAS